MRKFFLFLCLLAPAVVSGQTAEDFHDPAAMAAASGMARHMHGDTLNYLVIAERLENQMHDGNNSLVWEAQGWVGYDINKLWLKSEGEYDFEANDTGAFELQALWSHAISPFWDIQLGLRHDFENVSQDYAVIGLMGLAPYWFEVDAAAFVSDAGDVSTRLEAEYELRFTQRLILQPRVEINYAFEDDLETGIGQGFNKVHAGLRLRYEFKREIAPYIGVAWEKAYGNTANRLAAAGQDNGEVSVVAGLRVWY
jgi:copper resistance protein B